MNKYMSVLKNVDFIKYFFSINFTTLAQSFVSISIIWLIYEETKNPLLIAIFGVLTQLPAIVFGPLISKVLDRFNIGKAMFLFLLLRAGIFLIIFLLPFNDKISLSIIGLLIGLNSVIGIPLSAGGDIIIKEVCNDEQLVTANALMIIFFDISYIFGSISVAIMGVLGNNRIAFIIGAVLFFISAIIISTIKSDEIFSNNEDRQEKYTIFSSMKYIVKNSEILLMTINTTLWNMFTWGSFIVLLPIYVEQNLNNDSVAYGILNSLQSVGIILASLIIGLQFISKIKLEKLICLGIIVHCLLLILFYFSTNIILSVIILIIAGIASASVLIYKATFFQRKISRKIMGQVLSLILVLGSVLYSLGGIIIAFLIEKLGKEYFSYINLYSLIIIIVISLMSLKKIS